jgi:metal-responsive CopG/Arc/MetJ family transcriptional regulator
VPGFRIQVTIAERLWRQVRALAKQEGVSGSEWIRQAIVERLERERGKRRRP